MKIDWSFKFDTIAKDEMYIVLDNGDILLVSKPLLKDVINKIIKEIKL